MTHIDNPFAKDGKIEIFNLKNYLKEKLGLRQQGQNGEIDPDKVREAQRELKIRAREAQDRIAQFVDQLAEKWNEMKDMPESEERSRIASDIYIVAHEIKDLGELSKHNLCAHFAESLRDYIGGTELDIKAQRVICQALVDAIQLVYSQVIKETDDPRATELKRMVQKAVDKYG